MRFKSLSVLSILLLVGSNDARPSKLESPEIVDSNDEKSFARGTIVDDSSTWRPIEPRSSSVVKTDSRTELKDLQYMDQSLRTVATQLLNVTNPNDSKDYRENQKIKNNVKSSPNVLAIRKNDDKSNLTPARLSINDNSDTKLTDEIISGIGSAGVGYGRPTNSKFGYYESSHPGQAMAMTEEELERELMAASGSTRLITAHKNNPTTTGGISTWILLNPPTTTNVPIIAQQISDERVNNVDNNHKENKLTTPVEILQTTGKSDVKIASTVDKIVSPQSTTPMERITTLAKSTTVSLKKTTSNPTSTTEKIPKFTQTTVKLEKKKITSIPKTTISTDSSLETTVTRDTVTTPKTIVTTRKILDTNRSTVRSKVTTPKSTNVTSKPMATKVSKPSLSVVVNQSTKSKLSPTRKTSGKLSVETTKNPNTSKIEKVTFRPVHMITTPKSIENQSSNVERPIFLAKIKTSITTDFNTKPVQALAINDTVSRENETKFQLSSIEHPVVSSKINKPTKANNVLKVQLKKPTESSSSMEIGIKAPILQNEKMANNEKSLINSTRIVDSSLMIDDSPIDVKFDFNPEITKIDAVDPTRPADSHVETTKRPHKRKRNKIRRRKPASPVVSTLMETPSTSGYVVTVPSSISGSTENLDVSTELGIVENTIQESKIAPESKVTTATAGNASNTKNKKKHVQKPIGTQLYNFLSREVMPSFGVMSLVGLGLGLASYFLYPFGGAIARRNYVVEPDYKYVNDEYGGNYGQNEEDVFTKVLQGMTSEDGKYGGIKDYENNFYRYQQSHDSGTNIDGKHTTRRVTSQEPSRYTTDSSLIYHPVETTSYNGEKYRNTDFRYPELSATLNYYDRRKKPDFVGKKSSDRQQFVVGNVPKEYGYDDGKSSLAVTLPATTENIPTIFHQQDNYKYPSIDDSIEISTSYGQAEGPKSSDDYDEIEIQPSAVQVEHGPRSMRHVPTTTTTRLLRRRKRDSVIQLIPSRTEIAKEVEEIEKEEPLSNEIFEIIDSVIPGDTSVDAENVKKHGLEKKASGDDSTSKQEIPIPTKETVGQIMTQILDEKDKIIIDEATTLQAEKITAKNEIIDETTLATNAMTEKNEIAEKSTKYPTVEVSSSLNSLDSSSTMTTTTVNSLTIDEIIGTTKINDDKNLEDSSNEWFDHTTTTTSKPQHVSFNFFTYVKKVAEAKLRLSVAILKHASEGFARYLGHVQKRINGDE